MMKIKDFSLALKNLGVLAPTPPTPHPTHALVAFAVIQIVPPPPRFHSYQQLEKEIKIKHTNTPNIATTPPNLEGTPRNTA